MVSLAVRVTRFDADSVMRRSHPERHVRKIHEYAVHTRGKEGGELGFRSCRGSGESGAELLAPVFAYISARLWDLTFAV